MSIDLSRSANENVPRKIYAPLYQEFSLHWASHLESWISSLTSKWWMVDSNALYPGSIDSCSQSFGSADLSSLGQWVSTSRPCHLNHHYLNHRKFPFKVSHHNFECSNLFSPFRPPISQQRATLLHHCDWFIQTLNEKAAMDKIRW